MPAEERAALTDLSAADALAMLALQIEWGADEALDELPHDRLAAPARTLVPRAHQAAHQAAPQAAAEPARIAPAPRPAVAFTPGVPALSGRPPSGPAQQAQELAATAGSLAALHAAVAGFTGCALRDTATHTLFPGGEAGAPDGLSEGLMLIGEVPDADEDRGGHCFAGPSGDLLDRMLASIGLSRRQILIAPLIPWRPPGDRKVSLTEMAACLPFLHRLVALAQPKRLILMGVRPVRALLGSEAPLARMRGRWMPAAFHGVPAPIEALPMRHPGHLLANPLSRRDAWHDLLRLHSALSADWSHMREENRE